MPLILVSLTVKPKQPDLPKKPVNGPWVELDETRRVYHFPGGSTLEIFGVERVSVAWNGAHRLELYDGTRRIVRPGWLSIEIHGGTWADA